MNDENLNITIHDGSAANKLALPVDREQLGAFISNLLGQQQSIEREIYGTFDIDHAWLFHINSLIDQRIRQQNHATLTAFNAKIFYDDNLSRNITSLEAFEHFSETKKIKSQGVRIKWTYLISFPNKEVPEKQEISLYISAKAPAASKPEDPLRRLASSRHRVGVISYTINHTERTWGDDIESLLKQQLESILKEPTFIESIQGMILVSLAFVFFIGGFSFPELMNTIIQDKQISQIFSQYPAIVSLKAVDFSQVGQKLDLVLRAINPANSITKVGAIYRSAMMFAGLAMAMWCAFMADKESPSFVVLTPASQAYRDETLRKRQRNYILILLSFVASIAAGIIGNYFYYIISTKIISL